jgi:hypothetical protein
MLLFLQGWIVSSDGLQPGARAENLWFQKLVFAEFGRIRTRHRASLPANSQGRTLEYIQDQV